jgi:hypothetical protein
MSTVYNTMNTHFDVLSMPDYEGVSRRFLQGFESFVIAKKYQAARDILREDVRHETLVKNPDFIGAIVKQMDDEALQEKRYIFISLNPKALEALG